MVILGIVLVSALDHTSIGNSSRFLHCLPELRLYTGCQFTLEYFLRKFTRESTTCQEVITTELPEFLNSSESKNRYKQKTIKTVAKQTEGTNLLKQLTNISVALVADVTYQSDGISHWPE